MYLNPRARAFCIPLWCLLLLWMFFGSLVLAEELQIITETAAEDQEDLDEEALSLLASGLKSTVLPLQIPSFAFSTPVSESLLSVFKAPAFTPLELHDSPSRPLYQRLSVYRI